MNDSHHSPYPALKLLIIMPSDEDFYIPVFIFGGANLGIVFITTKFIWNFNTLCVVSSLYLIFSF